jgi:hypothetical protein
VDYIKNKLAQLAESLIDPIWAWVMARSWAFRASVLTLGGGIFLVAYNPSAVSENYRVALSTLKVATAETDRIALDAGMQEKLSSTTARLEDTVKADLISLAGLVPWSTAQAIAALGEKGETNRPAYANNAISQILGNKTGGCFCWAEIPSKDADGICMFIAGWVMLAFSSLREEISDPDVAFILSAQNVQGWWPIFLDKTDETFASTYATASIVLGLVEISRSELISSPMRQRVKDAVARAVPWLLTTRTDFGRWKSYPNMANSKVSDSISGLVLHALHIARPSDLRELDQKWLSGLPSRPPGASAIEENYVELRGSNTERIDHFIQIKLPWMLIATVDAFPNGGLFQRGRARNWIDIALSENGVLSADANTNNWWRAELLYALKYVQSRG